MSLFSSIILPEIEKKILAVHPQIAKFLLDQIKDITGEVIEWAENKIANKSLESEDIPQ